MMMFIIESGRRICTMLAVSTSISIQRLIIISKIMHLVESYTKKSKIKKRMVEPFRRSISDSFSFNCVPFLPQTIDISMPIETLAAIMRRPFHR